MWGGGEVTWHCGGGGLYFERTQSFHLAIIASCYELDRICCSPVNDVIHLFLFSSPGRLSLPPRTKVDPGALVEVILSQHPASPMHPPQPRPPHLFSWTLLLLLVLIRRPVYLLRRLLDVSSFSATTDSQEMLVAVLKCITRNMTTMKRKKNMQVAI